jgi:hypothetical protein
VRVFYLRVAELDASRKYVTSLAAKNSRWEQGPQTFRPARAISDRDLPSVHYGVKSSQSFDQLE